ncbi:MAG TPA: histidine phosphatase family protein, partial [Dehalococcoidia bacterium]|nr:histidine phosphatase family protein [Dehalococcoidia bacterium]
LGGFDIVVTSEIPRAIETAVAMGYASDQQLKDLGSLFGTDNEVDWRIGCAAIAKVTESNKKLAKAAARHAALVRSVADSIPDEGRALIVSHGGVIELGVIGLLPLYNYSEWGPSCNYCEGVKILFEGDACTGAQILRLSELTQPL